MTEFAIGRFRIRVVYRHVSTDEGVTLHIYGPTASGDEEVLRFDCFRNQPHYHLGWSYRSEPYLAIAASDPFGWAIDQLGSNMNQLLAAAGALPLRSDELDELRAKLDDVRAAGIEALRAA